jgi:hypothetical protein
MSTDVIETIIHKIKEINDIDLIVKFINYELLGSPDTEYNKELYDSIDNQDNLVDVMLDMISENKEKSSQEVEQLIMPIPNFNIHFKKQNFSEKGVDILYTSLKSFHHDKSDTLIDIFLEDTFGTNYDLYSFIGIVPYKKKWIGFIHSTFDNAIEINSYDLLYNDDFIKSLEYCKGLYVFSEKVKYQLKNIIDKEVDIYFIDHPVEDPVIKFDYNKFKNNTNKKIICASSFMGNTYDFYTTDFKLFQENCFKYSIENLDKYIINSYDKYLPSMSLLTNLKGSIEKENLWEYSLYKQVKEYIDSVTVIDHENKKMYDSLLSENIIYIDGISSFSLCVLNECIIRNTPFIIGKTSIEKFENYPLKMKSFYTRKDIYKAHKYLKKMKKNHLSINYFMCQLTK